MRELFAMNPVPRIVLRARKLPRSPCCVTNDGASGLETSADDVAEMAFNRIVIAVSGAAVGHRHRRLEESSVRIRIGVGNLETTNALTREWLAFTSLINRS